MNSEIFERNLILSRVDFDKNQKPRLLLADMENEKISAFSPDFNQEYTIKIDTTARYCTGWHSLESGENFTCPDSAELDKKFTQCQNCQKRTGFDPAFYNASQGEISSQQQERNSKPHFVYLAYFSDETIKVGISFCGRGMARLLEQGARAALILGEFSTANVARNYEEKISKMPDFCENVKASLKMKLLETPFDFEKAEKKLLESRTKIETALGVKFDQNKAQNLSQFYGQISAGEIIKIEDCDTATTEELVFSGELTGVAGYIWLAQNQGETLTIALKKYEGYPLVISKTLTPIELPERQASLFDF